MPKGKTTEMFVNEMIEKYFANSSNVEKIRGVLFNLGDSSEVMGKPGRRVATDAIALALFAIKERKSGKTWKEVFKACKSTFTSSKNLRNPDQIRKTVSRYSERQKRSEKTKLDEPNLVRN